MSERRLPELVRSVIAGLLMVATAGGVAGQVERGPEDLPGPPPLGLDVHMPIPETNPLTRAGVALGRRLFFDPVLSADRSRACASCHRPDRAFADTVPVSTGVEGRTGTRNTPSILNVAYRSSFFWDGRETSLERQVLRPIQEPTEMGLALRIAVARLDRDPAYRRAFRDAFGAPPSAEALGRALASYVRTLRSGDSPVDRYRSGSVDALTPEARAGFRLFVGKARCATCHVGPTFSDGDFHNTGVAWEEVEQVVSDPGRFSVTGDSADLGAFKTPTLRNVDLTAPYMHDGSLATLEDVVEFYDAGGRANPHLDPEIRPLRLERDEKNALVTFLRTLTGTQVREPASGA